MGRLSYFICQSKKYFSLIDSHVAGL
jgi:hypothetical protein